jgi:SpoVK/Ycf46/Vps4 family AAA+-type ATPase
MILKHARNGTNIIFHQVDEAALLALEERWSYLDSGTSMIEPSHFEQALSKVKPSVSKKVCAG